MIFSAEDDYFGRLWQCAFEALRQRHAGKAAANNHDPIGKLLHESFQRITIQVLL
ncbi:MAG: hypothetical protein WBY94_21065 [Polyangiaceae bacterium]